MDVATTVLSIVVGPVVILLLGWYGKGRFDSLDRRIDRLEERIDGRIDAVDRRIDGGLDAVDRRIDGLRSDMTQVALAVGVKPRAQNE